MVITRLSLHTLDNRRTSFASPNQCLGCGRLLPARLSVAQGPESPIADDMAETGSLFFLHCHIAPVIKNAGAAGGAGKITCTVPLSLLPHSRHTSRGREWPALASG